MKLQLEMVCCLKSTEMPKINGKNLAMDHNSIFTTHNSGVNTGEVTTGNG
jgi:hypothetical protein